jgi:subtilisin-like proprotein convertase family protein
LNQPISFDIKATITTTNGVGNGMLVLSNLDNTLGPYYRFETGTSMAAADVSGTLALMQDYFTNTLHTLPSPALLKAMLINGARPGAYDLQVNNSINFVGWGLVNLPNSLPPGIQTNFDGTKPSPIFFQDQNPTNALATGDTQTFTLGVQTNTAELRVTLVWTDPPGNPAAAIKLVNNLELIVTNMDNPTNPVVYYGNDIPADYVFNMPEGPTNTVVPDSINNVQNVIIPPYLGTNYTIEIIGRSVNVNAVSAQTNSYNVANPSGVFAPNVVQDYALVISSADGGVTGAFTVTNNGIVSNPTGDQDITYVTTTNQPYLDQFVGANPPLLGTNSTPIGTNGAVVLGMTNQWHFYVVTNNGVISSNGTAVAAPYAGFVTFLPPELSVPRMGVFAGTAANATRPEADIDLYVTTDSNLLILSPLTVSNCLTGVPSPNSQFNGVSLSRGGTEYVVDTNSTPGEVYYIGVQSEDQMGSEYDFFPVFSNIPFSSLDNNGDETVNGVPVPVNIPDGSPADPGVNFVMGLAIYPIEVANITASVGITHQNFGDLYGTLTHSGSASGTEAEDVLNNHDGLGSVTNLVLVYDDSGTNTAPGVFPSDGPGSLQTFFGQDGSGVWRLTEADTALTQTGSVQSFTMFIKRQIPLGNGSGVTNSLAPQTWFYDYVDVPPGATNLIISVTNLMLGGLMPLDVFVKLGAQPTTNDYDKMAVVPTLPLPHPGISISIGPTDVPPLQPGRYWIGVFNTDPNLGDPPQTFSLFATILPANPTGTAMDFATTGAMPLLDDAVTNADIWITNTLPVVSVNVGIRVEDSRISDLDFHLISPSGTRVDLMQNRGGADTNGAGATILTTNNVNVTANGTAQPNTNYLNVGETSGALAITYNFYTAPDEMTIYYGQNTDPANVIYDTGFVSNPTNSTDGYSGATNTIPVTFTLDFAPTNGVTSTYLTIIMDQTNSPDRSDLWTYTAGGVLTNYTYLTFTENTNLTTTPIKFAVPPFVPPVTTPTSLSTNSFEGLPPSDYVTNQIVSGWTVTANEVSVAADATNAYDGSNFLALAGGTIFTNLTTVPGQNYALTFAYRGPGIAAWWRGESNTFDSINGNNATTVTGIPLYTNGEVGRAFNFNGANTRITVPASASLAVSNLTLEAWIYQTVPAGQPVAARPVIIYGGAGQTANIQFWINTTNTSVATSIAPGALHAFVRDAGGVTVLEVDDPNPVVKTNQWCHLAFTANLTTGIGILYCNGLPVMTNSTPTPVTCMSFEDVNLGYMNGTAVGEPLANRRFLGRLDEVSIYNRPLSDSEIKAIYNAGTAGKFDPAVFNTSPAQSLAEALVNLGNVAPATILGNNTTWQTETISFTATQAQTPLQIAGIEPGMLLDDFILTQEPGDLFYLPEQSLDILAGEGAAGDWQLEIQDDRAGAFDTNGPPVLLGWDLQFVFDNTNQVPTVVSGGTGLNNQFIPPGDIAWYQVNVPSSASYATNLLLFASAPLNVWFDTNNPPTTNIMLLPDATYPSGTSGSVTLSTINAANPQLPPNIYSGQTYYLGVQNTNAITVNYGIQVNFDVAGQGSSLALSSVAASSSGTTLKWTASVNAQFQVQWTDDFTQPWNTYTNIITSSDGNFIFTDTAPPEQMRFYRLVQIPSGQGGPLGTSP